MFSVALWKGTATEMCRQFHWEARGWAPTVAEEVASRFGQLAAVAASACWLDKSQKAVRKLGMWVARANEGLTVKERAVESDSRQQLPGLAQVCREHAGYVSVWTARLQ